MTRFVSYTWQGQAGWGVERDGGVVDLFARHRQTYPTLREVITAGALQRLAEESLRCSPDFCITEMAYAIPVPAPEKIICVGVNFPDRNAEYKDGQEAPPHMSLFIRFARSFVGHDQPLTRPPETPQLDYEGEIAVVIGKGGRRIPEAQALAHIAGLTLCNEGTLRDWVRHAKFNVTQGKNWDGSGAMGPWLVPFTDPAQIMDVGLTTRVNGVLRQQDSTGRMLFPVARQIAYISTFTTLVPGDIIVTGTPTGAGARFDPPVWLVPGDVVEVQADGIGTLRNGVVDE
ncbi:fumarylacetoacetate hydrolase family protein [Fertoebacter nigrum]|uniref:Fumarylacetoacetate hydrolase family protein n=1 Tax=Fertoeibacter niger TaxID=2656921 RepID=A0A8X8KQ00_9RHOB|nr:fumarylacetoacetate hydrolase family protein [Fertoeibacter niger]NUB43537.1 fumarylacetoacetate hydrolase family protein [Fertoeibacter niger]